jgi:dihydroorotate dehydrogenase
MLELLADGHKRYCDERLSVDLGGVPFDNPILVGAGWDKAGRAVKGLYTLGFAGIEVGSVLAAPQPGNPKPRQFMLNQGVALNRLGFNSPGMDVVAQNLVRYRGSGIPIGISLGKNRDVPPSRVPAVHADVARRLYADSTYFVINVSSPNTPGLRDLQEKRALTDIAQAVNQVMDAQGARKPLFVKIAPELSLKGIDDVIEVVFDNGLTGIIATNTTSSSTIKARHGERWRNEDGGISGNDPEFRDLSTRLVSYIYRQTGGRMDIIGVGGVHDTRTALEKIWAGATAVQVVTGIREEGTRLPGIINKGIIAYMEREGIATLGELRGKCVDS